MQRYGRGVFDLPPLNFDTYIASERFNAVRDRHFHLSLVPVPFAGALAEAEVFILALNPGLSPIDYYGEYRVSDFRSRIEANLRQKIPISERPFLYLDPNYCWHSGFSWWESKFRDIATLLADHKHEGSYVGALDELSRRVAAIELVPYHSVSFRDHAAMARLPSAQHAREFVSDVVFPRVRDGNAVAVLTRQISGWQLPRCDSERFVVASQGRGVTLSRRSRGGQAILRHLLGPAVAERALQRGSCSATT